LQNKGCGTQAICRRGVVNVLCGVFVGGFGDVPDKPGERRAAVPYPPQTARRMERTRAEMQNQEGRQVASTRMGMSFLMGMVRSLGGSILKSEHLAGMAPVMRVSPPCLESWNGTF
jgi:hypothetical protein